MKFKTVEILAPAGSYDALKAAVLSGADAIYTGGARFGARAYANNLTEEELLQAIDYVHIHGKKLYLTVNTLLKDQEMEKELYDYLLPYYKQGMDAVIVQDMGVFRFVREHFPDLPIHASTQMTIVGVEGAKFLEKEGAERVVTARELSVDEIRRISRETNIEIESFVHGALCYCYSGQCLFSSFLGGRSGNRGQCAQPCRLMYQAEGDKKSKYLLSLKDICTLDLIPEMIETGIYSFKIEGRMKKTEYVAAVSYMYRKYADLYLKLCMNCGKDDVEHEAARKKYKVDEKDKNILMDIYNRGGFHTGYYHTRNGQEMISLDRPNHAGVPAVKVLDKQGRNLRAKALTDIHPQDVIELPVRKGREKADNYTCKDPVKKGQEIKIPVFADTPFQKGMILKRTRNEFLIGEIHDGLSKTKKKEKINGKFILSAGKSAKLILTCGQKSVEVEGDIVQEALNQPMDSQRIDKQMRKTGNTEYEFENLDIEITGNIFVPMQALNDIRRRGLEEIEKSILSDYRRNGEIENPLTDIKKDKGNVSVTAKIFASAQNMEQINELLEEEAIFRIYVDCVALPKIWTGEGIEELIEKAHQKKKEIYLIFPYIFRNSTRDKYDKSYDRLLLDQWDGVMVRNYESFWFLKEHGYSKPIVTEYNLYQYNREAQKFWEEKGISSSTVPLELNASELRHLDLHHSEMIIYGYIPMMISAGCIKKTRGMCNGKSGSTTLTDRYKKQFPVKNECDYCYNVIYNSSPLYLGDKMNEVRSVEAANYRLMFTVENAGEVRKILNIFKKEQSIPEGDFTRGHWKRGIK